MKDNAFRPDVDIALVGEIDARRELAAEGWLTINTNTEKGNFPNVDLIAVKRFDTRTIQVKTTNAEEGSHKDCLFLGRAEAWLNFKTPFFNSKQGPIKANVVILVHARRGGSRFVVLPVALAEKIAQLSVEAWYSVPKLDGGKRSAGFDARLPFTRTKRNPTTIDLLSRDALLAFENRWDILDAPAEALNDERVWGVDFGQFNNNKDMTNPLP